MKKLSCTQQLRSIINTRILGRHIYHVKEVDSTNNFALAKAKEGAPEGTMILADCQYQGRGQGDHTWYSPKGGIYLSIILRPKVSPSDINSWNMMAGLAVMETLGDYIQGNISLKFPNDVLVDGRKIAGILTEMRGDFKRIHYLVMGIGININFKMDKIPENLQAQMAVLHLEGPEYPSKVTFLQKLLKNLEDCYFSFLERLGE